MRTISRVLAAAALPLGCSFPAASRQAGLPPSWDGAWKGVTTLNRASGKAEEAAKELRPVRYAADSHVR